MTTIPPSVTVGSNVNWDNVKVNMPKQKLPQQLQAPLSKDAFQAEVKKMGEAAGLPAAPAAESKKGIKEAAAKAGNAIKGGFDTVVKAAKTHKVAAAAIGVAVAVAGAFGIYKGVQAHNNKVNAHQA